MPVNISGHRNLISYSIIYLDLSVTYFWPKSSRTLWINSQTWIRSYLKPEMTSNKKFTCNYFVSEDKQVKPLLVRLILMLSVPQKNPRCFSLLSIDVTSDVKKKLVTEVSLHDSNVWKGLGHLCNVAFPWMKTQHMKDDITFSHLFLLGEGATRTFLWQFVFE